MSSVRYCQNIATRRPWAAHRASHPKGCSSMRLLKSNKAAARGKGNLFDREYETEKLDSLLQRQPTSIRVVLGPHNCGKTATLVSYLQDKKNIVYIDCRGIDTSSPTAFLEIVLQHLVAHVPHRVQKDVLKRLASLPAFAATAKLLAIGLKISRDSKLEIDWATMASSLPDLTTAFAAGQTQPGNLNVVFNAISDLLKAWEKKLPGNGGGPGGSFAREWPVLIIDEANALMQWSSSSPVQLINLLRFFVKITKQDGRCHVVLATSEFGFQAWLSEAISSDVWEPSVIGDFTEKDARLFLQWELDRKMKMSTTEKKIQMEDSQWTKIFKVCGGNAGLLHRVAVAVEAEVVKDSEGVVTCTWNWDAALKPLWSVKQNIIEAWLTFGGTGFSAAQFACAAVCLLDAEHHAVKYKDMQLLLGSLAAKGSTGSEDDAKLSGPTVLQSMVEANALSIRPYSNWALDIPLEAFEDQNAGKTTPQSTVQTVPQPPSSNKISTIVTAPSALNLYCMGQLRQQLDEVLEHLGQRQAVAFAAASGQQISSPPFSPDIKAVQDSIENVERETKKLEENIVGLEAEIAEAKKIGDRDEVAALRAEKQQLRSEKQLLMTKEQQLRAEKQLLMAEK